MAQDFTPEEYAEIERRAQAVLDALTNADVNTCLSALSRVAAHVCVAYDHPNEAGISFTREFLEHLEDGISRIPAERTVTIPAPGNN